MLKAMQIVIKQQYYYYFSWSYFFSFDFFSWAKLILHSFNGYLDARARLGTN